MQAGFGLEAGDRIMEVYNSPDFAVKSKSDASPVTAADLVLPPPAEGSVEVAERVAAARAVQTARYADYKARTNVEIDGELLEAVATPDDPGRQLLAQAAEAIADDAKESAT